MGDRDEVLSSIAEEVVHRVSDDMAAKSVTLDDSAALLRVNSMAVSRGTMEGMAYGVGTYMVMALLRTNKRYRAPISGVIGVIHFITASSRAKRPEVIVAEFLPCETPLGDFVRSEVENRLPADDPLARLHHQMTDIVRKNPGVSRIEARTRVMTGRMPSAEGMAPMRARVREERMQRNGGKQHTSRETEEEREDRALDEEESYESVFGGVATHPEDDTSVGSASHYGSITASEPMLEKEYHHAEDASSQYDNGNWEHDYSADGDDYSQDGSIGSGRGSYRDQDAHLDEFSGVSKLEVAKQRRKERIRRQKLQGRRTRYGNSAAEINSTMDEEERYHSRYENEYNDSRFGGSTSSRWEDEYGNDDSEGPTFSRSF